MNEDTAFLRAILANPKDDAVRLVYADWLEERGDPRAEFLRVDCALAGLKEKDKRRDRLKTRLQELAAWLDTDWLAVVSRPTVENCGTWFIFRCPKKWDRLKTTDDESVRFCEACRKNVYYCSTIEEGRRHARKGDCVAIDLRVERVKGDMLMIPRLTRGLVILPEDYLERARDDDERQARQQGHERRRRRRK